MGNGLQITEKERSVTAALKLKAHYCKEMEAHATDIEKKNKQTHAVQQTILFGNKRWFYTTILVYITDIQTSKDTSAKLSSNRPKTFLFQRETNLTRTCNR